MSLHKRRTDYFTQGGFLDLDVRTGVIRSKGGTRMLGVSEDFLRGFVIALEAETGPAAPAVLRRCGEFFGQRLARRFEAELGQHAEISLRDRTMAELDALIEDMFMGCGLGSLTVRWDLGQHGVLAFDLEQSPMQDIGPSGHVGDDLLAGVLHGFFATFCDGPMRCIQTADLRRGDRATKFVLVAEAAANEVDQQLARGSKHDEVVAYLTR
jgi:predicted hydrocarbon binding protein